MRNIVSPLDGFASPFGPSGIPAFLRVAGKTAGYGLDLTNERYFVDRVRKSFADAVTFSRASTATMVDSTGTLVTVSANEPRIGHHVWNGSEWVNEGLLLESEARTNLVTYSEDFTDASWVKGDSTITANAAIAPDGTTTADTFTPDSGQVGATVAKSISVALTTYSFSFYAKAAGQSSVSLVSNLTGTFRANVFNLAAETATPGTGWSASIVSVGNGWYRCSCFATADVAASKAFQISNNSAGWTGDGSSGLHLWGAQLEAGSTPSSYLPTSGSQATRAAETLVADSANLPWPEPVVIGEELVTNGGFDSDVSGWSASAPATATWNAGQVDLARNSGSSVQNLFQTFSISIGSVYEVSIDVFALSNSVALFSTGGGVAIGDPITTTGTHTRYFVGKSGDDGIYVGLGGSTTATGTIDNISVKEINPLAVSLQMKGRMTYADDGTFETVVPVRWYLDGVNFIRTTIDTNASETGEVNIRQSAAGVLDLSASVPTAYSPGINVPFNIASRHGSTFINGAVDGTALTENDTPTALPDLSSTDLQIGYDFNGTISLFRIWADDIGDVGIAEASS